MKKEEAARIIAEAAVRAERETGFPAEVTFAQCALESAWLSRAYGNNAFGVKYAPGVHRDCQLLRTTEWFTPEELQRWLNEKVPLPPGCSEAGGRREVLEKISGPDARGRNLYRVRDWFARYGSLEEGIRDYIRLLTTRKRYEKAWRAYQETKDWRRLLEGIAEAGYSTAANYASHAMSVLDSVAAQALSVARSQITEVRNDHPAKENGSGSAA